MAKIPRIFSRMSIAWQCRDDAGDARSPVAKCRFRYVRVGSAGRAL